MKPLNEEPLPPAEVRSRLSDHRSNDLAPNGRAFAFTYDAGEDIRRVAQDAFVAAIGGNGLDPTAYPSAARLESEVVGACLHHLRAPEGAAGTATSGGTESCMLAVKTARDHFLARRPDRQPRLILPRSAHPAFHKAAQYFRLDVIPIEMTLNEFRADVSEIEREIDDDTALVVASAPAYSHGVVDPVAEIAEVTRRRNVLLHVDACIGGWVLPFLRELGGRVPDFDFEVDGVTSISVDLHKYGFAPKGLSVLLWRSQTLRRAQYFSCGKWPGYGIVNPTMLGSKSLAPLTAGWAVMQFLGRTGYRELVRTMRDATVALLDAVNELNGVHTVGRPDMGLVAIASERFDIFELADRLTARGWHVQPTYSYRNFPAHVHLIIDPGNAATMGEFIQDLRASVDGLPPPTPPTEAVLSTVRALLHQAKGGGMREAMSAFGIEGGRLPAAAAPLHRIVEALSTEERERLLVGFMEAIYQ